MADIDSDAIQAETIARLVDLAISSAARGTARDAAAEELCDAAASNPALLTAAATTARRLSADAGRPYVEQAAAALDAARDVARRRGVR